MVEYLFFVQGKSFSNSKEKFSVRKSISIWKLKYFYPAQQQTTTIDRRLMLKKSHMKKKENHKAFVRDARRPWMKAK